MRPYALKNIPHEEVELFWKVWSSVQTLGDLDLGVDDEEKTIELSCHILARAVVNVFPGLRCADGTFLVGYHHSWTVTEAGHIIDPYPVGVIGGTFPMMGDGNWPSPAIHLYRELSGKDLRRIYGDRFKKRWFRKAVGITTKALRQTAKNPTCEDIEQCVVAEFGRQVSEFEPLFMGMSSCY